MHYPARFHGASDSSDTKRKHDLVRFVDLNFLLDWTGFFSKVMDKQMQLGVKGPHTNHCLIFEARDVTNEDSEEQSRQQVKILPFLTGFFPLEDLAGVSSGGVGLPG